MLPRNSASEMATGRWPNLLAHFGIEDRYLTGKHGPCPICGGKDRFRFDNKAGRGTWICSQSCGSGDGFKLLQLIKGWTFREAAYQVEQIVGTVSQVVVKKEEDEAAKIMRVRRLFNETLPVEKGDPVWLYLNRRIGIDLIPSCLRYHPALPYYDGETFEYYPALVAKITDINGSGVGVHRIYLTADGDKAPVSVVKKLLIGKELSGASVKLSQAGEEVGIAEGIETALAAARRFSMPVWASISANLMEQWKPGPDVKKVVIFGDNDASFTGQASAFALAKKLRAKGLVVVVQVPEGVDTDWAGL